MTQVTVDLNGIQNGDTLKYNALEGKFEKGPAAAAPKVIYLANGDTLDDLGAGDVDGQLGLVRVGDEAEDIELRMRWRASTGKWYAGVQQNVKTNDAWAIDLTNQLPAAWRNAWVRPIHGVGWYHGTRAVLESDVAASDTTFTAKLLSDTFPAAGKVVMQGDVVTYTGISDEGGGVFEFTGVTGITATHKANLCPLFVYETSSAGDTGGWGITAVPLTHADALWTAGFRLRERVATAYLSGSQDNNAMEQTLYWFNYDLGDGFTEPDPFSAPSGALGHGVVLTSGAYPGKSDAHTADRTVERGFDVFKTDWQNWTAGTPTKSILVPFVYCRMPASAWDTGEAYAITHETQWIGTP